LKNILKMKKKTNKEFIEECNEIHNFKYDYSLVNYDGVGKKVKIICPKHGEFDKIARDHINGQGCPECSKVNKYNSIRLESDVYLDRVKKTHGDKYDYSKVEYKTLKDYITIICPIHGEFNQRADVHLKGEGCKKCYLEKRGKDNRLTTEEVICKFKEIHGDKYDYSKVKYNSYKSYVTIICPEHGEFEQLVESHLHGGNCVKCNTKISKGQLDLRDFISSLGITFIENDRSLLDGKELDIYIPSHNLAIEYNGLYWYSELFVDDNYHLNKTEMCEEKGVQLIHIFEDEWLYKQDIVKSRIKNILGLTENKIYARKCEIKEIDFKTSKLFLENNHIQGVTKTKTNIGLYYNDELVSLMCFGGRPFLNNYEYELIRFCNKLDTSVVGGASKLLKYFIKNYKPKEIISYADRRWSNGGVYHNLGFKFKHNSKPNWFILEKNRRYHRLKYQKHKLVERGYDVNKTAHQICLDDKLYRIYDCGHKTYYYELPN